MKIINYIIVLAGMLVSTVVFAETGAILNAPPSQSPQHGLYLPKTPVLINATFCEVLANNKPNPQAVTPVTAYVFTGKSDKLVYSGVSLTAGETKAVPQVLLANTKYPTLAVFLGASTDPTDPRISAAPYVTNGAYVVQLVDDKLCKSNAPCVVVWGPKNPCKESTTSNANSTSNTTPTKQQ
jgi:hypothetical protein